MICFPSVFVTCRGCMLSLPLSLHLLLCLIVNLLFRFDFEVIVVVLSFTSIILCSFLFLFPPFFSPSLSSLNSVSIIYPPCYPLVAPPVTITLPTYSRRCPSFCCPFTDRCHYWPCSVQPGRAQRPNALRPAWCRGVSGVHPIHQADVATSCRAARGEHHLLCLLQSGRHKQVKDAKRCQCVFDVGKWTFNTVLRSLKEQFMLPLQVVKGTATANTNCNTVLMFIKSNI